MAQEPMEWASVKRRSGNGGGCWVYIDAFTLKSALKDANMPENCELEVRRYAIKDQNGIAKVLLKFRKVVD